jgi:hypothetical protein
MNLSKFVLLATLCFGIAVSFSQPEVHAQSTMASCISIVSNTQHVMVLQNNCSQIVLLQVYDNNSIGVADGQLYQNQRLNVVTQPGVPYRWFACPANTVAVKTGTRNPVDYNTSSYDCVDPN